MIAKLTEHNEDPSVIPERSFMLALSMLKAVEIIGIKLSDLTLQINEKLGRMELPATTSFIVAGQQVNADARKAALCRCKLRCSGNDKAVSLIGFSSPALSLNTNAA